MTNVDKNKQFENVCKNLDITDPSQRTNFHRYIGKYYKKESNSFSYKKLLEVGKEFIEIEGKIMKIKKR